MTITIDWHDTAALSKEIQAVRERKYRGTNVGLVYGGVSAEDRLYLSRSPVEQMSVTALSESLDTIGTAFRVLDPCEPGFVSELLGVDIVLSNLHGPFGEDGRLQGLLDWLRRPYCGNGVAASAIAADKILCKRYMKGLGVPTPPWQVWTGGSAVTCGGLPMMVKPTMGGSSVGMSLVRTTEELTAALEEATRTDPSPVLVEHYISGTPVTVGLLELPGGVLAFPPLATEVQQADFYDADTKLDADGRGGVSVTLADLPPSVLRTLTRHARTLWEGLGCQGGARVDFMVTADGEVFALEVNTTPGMSRDSNFAAGASMCGLTHEDVVRAMLHQALARPTYDVPLPVPSIGAVPAQLDATV
ncbi:ATP-grasp domain-containing protein [Kitasatospora sp. NPDC001309]|uniref:D-alanine--D-alanine ligase family protein n=1 Tax=unclassified Kitasatospora TaxID=2633591 RepID=UPI0036A18E13